MHANAKAETVARIYCCECTQWHTWRIVHRPGSRRPYRAQLRTGRELMVEHKARRYADARRYITQALIDDGVQLLDAVDDDASGRRDAAAARGLVDPGKDGS